MRIKGHGKVSRVPFSDGLELYLLPHRVIVRFVRCTKREPAALPPKTAPQLTQDLDVASGFEFAPWRSPGAAGHALRSLAQMPRNVSPGGQVRAKFRLVPLLANCASTTFAACSSRPTIYAFCPRRPPSARRYLSEDLRLPFADVAQKALPLSAIQTPDRHSQTHLHLAAEQAGRRAHIVATP